MRQVLFASSFKLAFERLTRRRPNLQARVEDRLRLLAADPFTPALQIHRLKGKLSGAWACSVEYDCRIVFNFVKNLETGEDDIVTD